MVESQEKEGYGVEFGVPEDVRGNMGRGGGGGGWDVGGGWCYWGGSGRGKCG